MLILTHSSFFFFLNDPAPTEFSPLPLHAALPISSRRSSACRRSKRSIASRRPSSSRGPPTIVPTRSATGADLEAACAGVSFLLGGTGSVAWRSEEHTSELQSRSDLVCRLLLEKKK